MKPTDVKDAQNLPIEKKMNGMAPFSQENLSKFHLIQPPPKFRLEVLKIESFNINTM